MIFLFEEKMFRSQDLLIFFGESKNFKIYDVIINITAHLKSHYRLFL